MPGSLSGGMGIHVWNVSREQARLGHDVTVFCPLREAETVDDVTFEPWEYHIPKFQTELACHIETAKRTVARLFKRKDWPDILHCHEWDSAPVVSDLALYTGLPWVSTLHISNTLNSGYMTPYFTETVCWYLWWEQMMLRSADANISISHHYADWMRLFSQGKPIHVVPNGVKVEDFQNGVTREKPDNRTLAFFHGRLVLQKGIDLMVEAAKQRDDILWVIAGPLAGSDDGRRLEDGLLDDLYKLEKQGRIILPGMISQTEVGAWLRACDVAVYPHHRAPFDLSVLEALACGAQVVTTGVDAIAEYANTDNAFLCKPTAKSLLEAIDDSKHIRKKDVAKSVAKYTWENATKAVLKVYEGLIYGEKNNAEPERAYQ
jgi:glycosyltransferase involved in cell wall biosynthesis